MLQRVIGICSAALVVIGLAACSAPAQPSPSAGESGYPAPAASAGGASSSAVPSASGAYPFVPVPSAYPGASASP